MIFWKDDKNFGVDCMRCTHTFTVPDNKPSVTELVCPKCGTSHVFRQQKNLALKLRIGKLKKR